MKSKDIVNDIYNIMSNNGVKLLPIKNFKFKNQYYFQSDYRNPSLLEYFEKGSEKWFRLNELVYGFQGKIKSLEQAKLAFDITYSKVAISKISFSEIIDIISKRDVFTNKYIIKELLKKSIKIHPVTIGVYLHLLRKANIIQPIDTNKTKKYKIDNENVILKRDFRSHFFNDVMRKFKLQQELADYLGRTQSVISNYLHGKKSIPIYDLKKMTKLINIDKNTLNKNVLKITKKTPTFEFYRLNNNIKEWRVPWRPYLSYVEVIKNAKR